MKKTPTISTVSADSRGRIPLSSASAGTSYSRIVNPDGSITLTPIPKAELEPVPDGPGIYVRAIGEYPRLTHEVTIRTKTMPNTQGRKALIAALFRFDDTLTAYTGEHLNLLIDVSNTEGAFLRAMLEAHVKAEAEKDGE